MLLVYDRIEKYDEGYTNSVLLHYGYTMDPDESNVPKAPDERVETSPNT